MLEIEYKDKAIIDKLYNMIKSIILSNKDKPKYNYSKHQHYLYEESEYPGISEDYYNENGIIEFENNTGKTIIIEINRWHPHKHNGYSGLNGNPCLSAQIYVINSNEKELLWELKVESGTLHWKAKVTSLDIPKDVIIQKIETKKEIEPTIDDKCDQTNQETIDKRILFDECNKLYEHYCALKKEKDETLQERKKAIEKVVEEVMSSYCKKIDNYDSKINNSQAELSLYDDLISKYSTFDENLIGNAIVKLIKIFDGKDFLFKNVTHTLKKRVHGPIDSWDEIEKKKACIVIDCNEYQSFYDNSSEHMSKLDELTENGKTIVLCDDKYTFRNHDFITFFTMKDGQIISKVKFGNYDYIREFVIDLVQYRFQRKLEVVTENDIIICMQNFISKHEDIITKNYILKIKEKIFKRSL